MGIPSFTSLWKLVAGVLTPTKPNVPVNIPGPVTIGGTASVAGLTDTALTASKLVNTDANKKLASTYTLSTDGTLAANLDTNISSQKAVKTYADALVIAGSSAEINARGLSQAIHMTAAASGSNGIQSADSVHLDFGTGNFTGAAIVNLSDWTPSANVILAQKHDVTNGWILTLLTTGILRLTINAATYDSTAAPTITDANAGLIGFSVTRETASVAGSVIFTFNGVQVGSAVAITAGAPTTVDNAVALYVMGTSAVRSAGRVYFFALFNRPLTPAEHLDLYRNGITFADKWGSQTEEVAGDDSDFDTVGNWTNGGTGATVTGGYDSGDAGHTTCLRIEAGDNANEVASLALASLASGGITAWKNYRLTFDYKWVNKPSTVTTDMVQIGTGAPSSATLSANEGVWGSFSSMLVPLDATTAIRIYANKASGGSADNELLIDNISLLRTGATLALEPEGIQPAPGQWLDSSSNKLHALQPATGSSLVRPKNTFEIRWTNTWAGTHEAQYVGGVNQAVLPSSNIRIESITMVVTGAAGNVILGDGSTTNKFVASVALAAYLDCTVASRNHDGTNRKLVIDPDTNLTGSITTTIKGIILD